jgi:predicted phosphodiesterase
MTIRVLAMSDLHSEFDEFHFPLTETPDLLILAGDIGLRSRGVHLAGTHFPGPFPKVVIAGNHEFYAADYHGVIDLCRAEAKQYSEVYFLERDQHIFKIRERSVRVLGCVLWTDFLLYGEESRLGAMMTAETFMNDFGIIRFEGATLKPAQTVELHQKSLAWLRQRLSEAHDGPTIVVTHHAPSERSQPPRHLGSRLAPAFSSNLDDFILEFQPDLWVHGHTHWGVDYRVGATRVYSNQRGYPGEDCGFRREMIEL